MDPLRVEALGSAALNVPRLPLVIPKLQADAQAAGGSAQVQALAQGLAQTLVQQTFQTAVTGLAGSTPTGFDLTQGFTSALASALNAAQSTTSPSTTATATPVATAESGTATPIPGTAASAVATEALTTSTPAETGASADFALLTALRFGAGVIPLAAPAVTATDLGATLVRDAAAVPRLANLQAQPGRPGPEDFTRLLQAQAPQALQAYQAVPAATTSTGVNLLV